MQHFNGPTYSPQQMWASLSQHVARLQQTIGQQQEEINRLSKQVAALSDRVNAAESKPTYHVDKLEYHFDQLKVEKLDGTLNIGMTPPSDEQMKEIGQLAVPGAAQPPFAGQGMQPNVQQAGDNLPGGEPQSSGPNVFPVPGAPSSPNAALPGAPYPEIRKEIDRFLNTEAPARLAELESEYGFTLDPYHRRLVIEDIRKQMDPRILYYIQQGKSGSKPGRDEARDPSASARDVCAKAARDIENAMRAYLSSLKGGAGPQGGMNE